MAVLGPLLKTCPRNKLTALTKVAKHTDAFGSVSTWDSSVYRDNGIVVGLLINILALPILGFISRIL